ncbi:MAG: UvrB/UvrC motif-containing protein [Defluviitaleaceae bacterium]|nr:UvrB/UvrC motif-containing protein [Defluviitaleaceae bacterium]
MLCVKCQKNPATVHIQQFMLNGVKTELHLCQECTFKLDNPEMLISFENVFKGFLEQMKIFPVGAGGVNMMTRPDAPCSRCGMTYNQFKAAGKLGCDTCYQSFSKEVQALLKNVQGSIRHEGKYPKRLGAGIFNKRQADDLRAQLKKAIEEENFEEAAKFRDEIRALELAEPCDKNPEVAQ